MLFVSKTEFRQGLTRISPPELQTGKCAINNLIKQYPPASVINNTMTHLNLTKLLILVNINICYYGQRSATNGAR